MEIFEQLGLTSSATTQEVKQAWRRLVSIHHPDHGGDGVQFNNLRQAYKRCLELAQLNDVAELKCTNCNGSGKIDQPHGFSVLKIMCPVCKGSGRRK